MLKFGVFARRSRRVANETVSIHDLWEALAAILFFLGIGWWIGPALMVCLTGFVACRLCFALGALHHRKRPESTVARPLIQAGSCAALSGALITLGTAAWLTSQLPHLWLPAIAQVAWARYVFWRSPGFLVLVRRAHSKARSAPDAPIPRSQQESTTRRVLGAPAAEYLAAGGVLTVMLLMLLGSAVSALPLSNELRDPLTPFSEPDNRSAVEQSAEETHPAPITPAIVIEDKPDQMVEDADDVRTAPPLATPAPSLNAQHSTEALEISHTG